MSIQKITSYGTINISTDAIASVTADAALDCYGVVGLAPKNSVHQVITELLKRDSYAKGVIATKEKKGYSIEVYLVVSYGVKITEVLSEVQKRVKYELLKAFGSTIVSIDVFAQSLEMIEK